MLSQWLAGLMAGTVYGAIGMVVVLIYRTARILEFTVAAVGAWGLYLALTLHDIGMLYPAALVAGAIFSGVIAAAIAGGFSRWFGDSTALDRCTVSIALFISLIALAFRVFGDSPRVVPSLLVGGLAIGQVHVSADLLALLIGVMTVAAGMDRLLAGSRLGFRLQALAQHPVVAELLGLPVGRLRALVSGTGGALACLSLALATPTRPSDFLTLSLTVVPGLAAAVFGRLRSLRGALVSGLMIGILDGVSASMEASAGARQALVLLVVVFGLIWMQRHERWDTRR